MVQNARMGILGSRALTEASPALRVGVAMLAAALASGCARGDAPARVDGGTAPGPMDGGVGSPDAGAATCRNGVRDGDEPHTDCGGSCPPCADGDPCRVGADCLGGVCEGGLCRAPSCADGVRNGTETDVDCGGACPGCAGGRACRAAEDCTSGVCAEGTCAAGSCGDGVRNADETDVDCGGSCPRCEPGRGCGRDEDCLSARCVEGRCGAPSCTDGVRNRDESDVDCGGTQCAACVDGLRCAGPTDCASGVCEGGLCRAPSCTDGARNGAETDVDCGGSCPRCAAGSRCGGGADCESGVCSAGVCTGPSCGDGLRNGAETDVDCGGPTLCARCPDGARCEAASDCLTGTCTSARCGAGCRFGLIAEDAQFSSTTIQRLLTENGHTFTVHNANGTSGVHTSNAALVASYTHIVLHKRDRELNAAERANLRSFLDAGGRLIVTGYDSLASPSDLGLASIVNCTSPSDGPFSSGLMVTSALHPILMGPTRSFLAGTSLTAATIDHDSCTLGAGAVSLVSVSTTSKLFITENVGPGRGMVVYWNGNGSTSGPLDDWEGLTGSQPALQNLFVNVLDYLCRAP